MPYDYVIFCQIMSIKSLKSSRELLLGKSSKGIGEVQKPKGRNYQVCHIDISISRYSSMIVRKAKKKKYGARRAQVRALVPTDTAIFLV